MSCSSRWLQASVPNFLEQREAGGFPWLQITRRSSFRASRHPGLHAQGSASRPLRDRYAHASDSPHQRVTGKPCARAKGIHSWRIPFTGGASCCTYVRSSLTCRLIGSATYVRRHSSISPSSSASCPRRPACTVTQTACAMLSSVAILRKIPASALRVGRQIDPEDRLAKTLRGIRLCRTVAIRLSNCFAVALPL